ncbi:MAG: septum site-determining protein MinC [Synechococcaceae cyanobacterium]|jgi:septum site-determining protein MinC
MAARLIPAPTPALPHWLVLPPPATAASCLEEIRYGLGSGVPHGNVNLDAGDWLLPLRQLRELQQLLVGQGLQLQQVASRQRQTLVAAAALGLETLLCSVPLAAPPPEAPQPNAMAALNIHQGPLRSGEHLQSDGSVLLLGDLNPGGRISAAGHVLVWGRLRGIAHAGCRGDRSARIVALQLRPLQLRIAEMVARGPEDTAAAGMAEQAHLVDGVIQIDPASPLWPLTERGR